jgi:hypothetical protein
MKMAKACGATRLKNFGDSNLVVQQVWCHQWQYDSIQESILLPRRNIWLMWSFACQQSKQRGSRQFSKYRVPVFTRTTRSFLGGDHREINKKHQSLDYRRASPAPSNRLGAGSSGQLNPKKSWWSRKLGCNHTWHIW